MAMISHLNVLLRENERLREALHQISLCSQNSASSREECGRIARAALGVQPSQGQSTINERHVMDAATAHGVFFVNRSYGLRSTDTIGLETLTSIVLDVIRNAGVALPRADQSKGGA